MNKQTKGISFKNFRCFPNFPMLQLGNITYIVGRNNSGKSTMVKALLLITDYLQNQLSDTFSFDNVVLEDANIVTFGRAKNNISKEPTITFEYQLDEFDIHIVISGQKENTKAKVNVLSVNDAKTGIDLKINYSKGNITVSKELIEDEKVDDNKLNVIKQLEASVSELQEELDAITDKTSKESIELITAHRKASEKLKDAKKLLPNENKIKGDMQYTLTYPLSDVLPYDNNNDNLLRATIEKFIRYNEVLSTKSKKVTKEINEIHNGDNNMFFDYVLELKRSSSHLTNFSNKLTQSINRQYFYFIGANPSKQSALFYLRDKNNALAQAIHNFYQLTAGEKNNEETRFIKEWMQVFEVGVDFSINMQAGEAYEFKIFEEDSKTAVSLSDKGMGSLQAMTLILKIASLIRSSKKNKKFFTVLVEEPELNLHPALQSKLSDFFHYVNKEYKFNFIIETHSEYIVRRSQLIALENDYLSNQELNPNPFSIFYFHKEDGPYQMEYNNQGKFNRDFGPGFYDEAGSLTLKMIKELRKNKAQ
ncbi:AAA family ATPase [Tenacibaculum maritimum]|uniref:AAA family ATPase n=1 Tax=Tenacibaculum maritimum TaxID=107401 RepID=UPI003877254F